MRWTPRWRLAAESERALAGSYRAFPAPSDGQPGSAWCESGQQRIPIAFIDDALSHILSLVRRQLPDDWTERYNTAAVLIETFVETPRYTGAVYKASGWLRVGTTQGRGRYDRDKLYDKPKKDIWLRPLRKDWRRIFNR